VKALAPILPYTNYTASYGNDSMRMMFGLPQSGIKRLRKDAAQTDEEREAPAQRKVRSRSDEKRSAMRTELKSLGIPGGQASPVLRSASRLRNRS
jgi:hypothetical protein